MGQGCGIDLKSCFIENTQRFRKHANTTCPEIHQQTTLLIVRLFQKPPSTIRFFNRTDYYTLHGEDASFASEFTGSIVKTMGTVPKLDYTSLNKIKFDMFVRELLLIKQYRVEVYVKNNQTRNNEWSLEYKGSPGNLSQFEEILFESGAITFSNSVMGIKIIKNTVRTVCLFVYVRQMRQQIYLFVESGSGIGECDRSQIRIVRDRR